MGVPRRSIIIDCISPPGMTSALLFSMGMSSSDNLCFSLAIRRFGLFEDVDQVLTLFHQLVS